MSYPKSEMAGGGQPMAPVQAQPAAAGGHQFMLSNNTHKYLMTSETVKCISINHRILSMRVESNEEVDISVIDNGNLGKKWVIYIIVFDYSKLAHWCPNESLAHLKPNFKWKFWPSVCKSFIVHCISAFSWLFLLFKTCGGSTIHVTGPISKKPGTKHPWIKEISIV